MRIARYLALVVVATVIAIATVASHVERTQLGYEARALENDLKRLEQARRAAIVERDRASAPEKLVARAGTFGIASPAELKSLLVPVAPPKTGAAR
jgi:cobalamin biosynthesis protein CobD/CbiB